MSGLETDQGWESYLVSELNGGDPLRAVIAAIWKSTNRWQHRPELHYLYAKRQAIRWLLGNLDEAPTPPPVEDHGMPRAQTRKSILFGLLADVTTEIATIRKGGRPSVGTLTAKAFVESPLGQPDANAVDYLGNPNVPARRVVRP